MDNIGFSSATKGNGELIQHTDQIAEVRFTGSSYELGKYVGEVAKDQILGGIDRFDHTLGVMLPGLNVISLSKSFEDQDVFDRLKATSPDAEAYIQGLAKSLNRTPCLLLAIGMSDEAIYESQRNGGVGFLQAGHDPELQAKCTVMGISDKNGKGWAGANFDYMGVYYEGLIMLNHTDTDGKIRVIQTWAGLVPYGGISKGGQVIIMNTMVDEGTAREMANGNIIDSSSTPSYYLSWEPYNIEKPQQLIDMFKAYQQYTSYFSYTAVGSENNVLNIENNYGNDVSFSEGDWKTHANHSLYIDKNFVDDSFAGNSLARQKAVDMFMGKATIDTPESQVRDVLEAKPLWKGRSEMTGTVTSTYYAINGKEVDMFIRTDENHPTVHITNYQKRKPTGASLI